MEDFIKRFWQDNAELYGTSFASSWKDFFAISLEIKNIKEHIQREGLKILDVGCANGFATISLLEKKPSSIIGIDYSEKMISNAKTRKEYEHGKVDFQAGNILDIHFEDNTFDFVYTTRVLINLRNWDEQVQGIKECLRVTKHGGSLLLSEAFWEPLVLINSIRTLLDLPPLVEHDFNRYLKKNKIESLLNEMGLKYDVSEFSSLYYFGTRVLRELLNQQDRVQDYQNSFNEEFYKLSNSYTCPKVGIQQAYIIKKP